MPTSLFRALGFLGHYGVFIGFLQGFFGWVEGLQEPSTLVGRVLDRSDSICVQDQRSLGTQAARISSVTST